MLPSIFLSHGTPELSILNNKSSMFLKNISSNFKKPKYILVISAHWITRELKILSCENPNLIYDFYGFAQELYKTKYPIKNDKNKIEQIINLFRNKNIEITEEKNREGYDHGVWSPLSLIYPDASIPVLQISLPMNYSINELINLGSALKELRKDTLIIGSGAMTHDLRNIVWQENAPVKNYCKEFRNWIVKKVENGQIEELKDFQNKAPYAKENHPTLEHILPLFISLGASSNKIGKSLNNEYMYGNQSMDTIIFKE